MQFISAISLETLRPYRIDMAHTLWLKIFSPGNPSYQNWRKRKNCIDKATQLNAIYNSVNQKQL